MAKRRGTELNHDNWDEEEQSEEPGVFKRIGDSALQRRVIKQARRSLKTAGTDPETGSEISPASPFSAFSGFTKQSPSSQSPFGTFISATKIGADSKPEKSNGDSSDLKRSEIVKSALSLPASSSSSSSASPFSIKRPAMSEELKSKSKSIEYFRQLQSLNESVLSWMQMHFTKNPCSDFTPVFNDYKTHLQKIESAYVPEKEKRSTFAEFSKDNMFKMPQQPASSSQSETSPPSKTPLKFFTIAKTAPASDEKDSSNKDDEMAYGAGFASNTTNTSTFSFGFKESLTASSTGSKVGPTSSPSSAKKSETSEKNASFSFGLKKSFGESSPFANTDPGSGFRFSAVGHSTATNANTETGDPNEQEYVPPKNDFSQVEENDAVYSKRCKLFYQKDGTYMDKGIGTLHLKPLDDKMQLLIRADTSLGNILLNIMLSASLPMERTGKNNVLIVCVPNPPVDAESKDSKTAIPLLLRVKTAEDADELLEKLNELKS